MTRCNKSMNLNNLKGVLRGKIPLPKNTLSAMSATNICDALKRCKGKGLSMPPMKKTYVGKKIVYTDPNSPLTASEFIKLLRGTQKVDDVRKIAKKLGVIDLNNKKEFLMGKIIKILNKSGIAEPIVINNPIRPVTAKEPFEFNNNKGVRERGDSPINYVSRMNRMSPVEKANEAKKPINSRMYYNNGEGRKVLQQTFGRVDKNLITEINRMPSPNRRETMMRAYSAVYPTMDDMEVLKLMMNETNNKLVIQKGFDFVNKKVGFFEKFKQKRVKKLLNRIGAKRDPIYELRTIVNANLTNSNNNVIRKAIPLANNRTNVSNLLKRTRVDLSKFKNKKNFMKELRNMVEANYSMSNNKVIEMAINSNVKNVRNLLNKSNINVNRYRRAMNKRERFKNIFGDDVNAFERFKYSRGGIENAIKSIVNSQVRNRVGKAVTRQIAQESNVPQNLVRTTPSGDIQIAERAAEQVRPVVQSYQPPPITIQMKSGNVRVNASGGSSAPTRRNVAVGNNSRKETPSGSNAPTRRNAAVGNNNRDETPSTATGNNMGSILKELEEIKRALG